MTEISPPCEAIIQVYSRKVSQMTFFGNYYIKNCGDEMVVF